METGKNKQTPSTFYDPPVTVIYSFLLVMPVCTHHFSCYFICPHDIRHNVRKHRAGFVTDPAVSQEGEKENCLSFYKFSWVFLCI